MGETVLEAVSLRKAYLGRQVLDGIDLEVSDGETLVILGPSGSGKSTLLRCLVGLERPDQGVVRLHGVDIFEADTRTLARLRERIGMTFQGGALFGSMTVAGNIDVPLSEYTRLPLSTRRIIARIKLGTVGLEDALDRYPSELSGGMRKRVALARAMALDPETLFCDEPSAGLDPITAASLDQLLNQLKRTFDVTLVVVTHEMASAFAIADRIAMMHEGKIRISGPPEEVRASQDPVVRRFLDRVPRDNPRGTTGGRIVLGDGA